MTPWEMSDVWRREDHSEKVAVCILLGEDESLKEGGGRGKGVV